MRVSSNKDDAGFDAFMGALAAGRSVHVYLDGVEQTHVSVADDELGQVTRCVLDEKGRIQVNPAKSDEVWIETVTGKVEVRFEGGH